MFPKSDLIIKTDGNGNTSSYRPDLGIPKKSPITKLPRNKAICGNAKRESVTLSTRINEITYAALDLMARQNGVSLSSFMNDLLNYYVNQEYSEGEISGSVFYHALALYLDRLAFKLSKMSARELEGKYGYPEDPFLYGVYATHGTYNTIFLSSEDTNNSKEASYENTSAWTPDKQNAVSFAQHVLDIPEEKYPYVVAVLQNYVQKKQDIFAHRKAEENDFTETSLRKIVDIINSSKKKDLVGNLVTYLKGDQDGL